MRLCLLYTIILCSCLDIRLYGQENRYFTQASDYASIYNGVEQIQYPRDLTSHPYLRQNDYSEGSLVYDHVVYPSVPLKLDWYRNELIIQSPDKLRNIIIPADHLQSATLYGYTISYILQEGEKSSIQSGYYIVLYSGKYVVLEKQHKYYKEDNFTSGTKKDLFFRNVTRFYLKKDGVYHTIKGMRNLLQVFAHYKKDIKEYCKAQNLDFMIDPEKTIIAVARYCEKLEDEHL